MRPICVYLSGPIAGVEDYRANFERAAKSLQQEGYEVLSPATLPAGRSNALYMRVNFGLVEIADFVVLLPGWENSKGCQLEKAFAEYIGKPITEKEEKT